MAAGAVGGAAATMSEAAPRRKRTESWPVTWAALALFLVVFMGLAIQLRAGRDPAVGVGPKAAVEPRRVLVKRIVKRRVIVRVIPSDGGTAAAPRGAGTSVGPSQPAEPAPAAAAAPAPAPAPAPTTRSS